MISIKSKREIELMREAGHILALTREMLVPHIKPGVSTAELDSLLMNLFEARVQFHHLKIIMDIQKYLYLYQ